MENIDKELSELNRLKLEASEREDYRAASEYKRQILQLLEKKQELEKQAQQQKKDYLKVQERPERSGSDADLSNDSSDDEDDLTSSGSTKDDNYEEDRVLSPNNSSSSVEAEYEINSSSSAPSTWQKPSLPKVASTRQVSGVLRHPSRESVQFSSRSKESKEAPPATSTPSNPPPTITSPTLSINGAPAATSAATETTKPASKPPGVVSMKVVASVGGINSVVNLKVDLNFTVESVIQKVLRRFPEDNEKYSLYLPNDISSSSMECSKKMLDYYPQLEAAKFSLDLKKRTATSPLTPSNSAEKNEDKPKPGTLRGHNYGETESRDNKSKSGRFGEIFGRSSRRFSEADMKPLKEAAYMDPEVFFESVKRDSKDDVAFLISQEGHQVMLQRDADNQTALHVAATHNSVEVAQTLLKSKMEFNSKDKFGNTPTMSSMIHGNLRITELLLNEGAEPAAANLAGNNALHYMASGWDEQQSPKVFHLLMRKCNLNSQNKEKDTPFHKVVASGNIECLRMMLNYQTQWQNYPSQYPGLPETSPNPQNIKPDLNIINNKKETCLHVAARLGNLDIVKLLLEFGSDPNKSGDCGTPKNVAQLYGFEEVATLLAANAGNIEQQEQERGQKAENALKSEIQERLKLQNQYEQLNKLYKDEMERRKRAEANNSKLTAQLNQLQEQYETLRKFAENHMKERDKLSLEKKTLEHQLEEITTPKQPVLKTSSSLTSSTSSSPLETSGSYTVRSKSDTHESLLRELKQRINVSSFREWEQAYLDPEVDLGIDANVDSHRYEQLVEEWHHNKLKEIESMLFNDEESVLVSPHRRFIKMGELFLGAAEPQVPHTAILLNDLFLVCSESEAKDPKKILLALVLPVDMISANDVDSQIGGKYCFDILRTDSKQKYVFGFSTLADKQKWLKEVKNCINNIPAVQDENKQKKSKALRGKELITDMVKCSLRTLTGGSDQTKESKLTKEMVASYVKSLETNDSSFTKLNLAKMNVKFKMLQQIAHSLEHNLVISQIILSHCQLEDKGIIALVNGLKDNKSLTVLMIDDNSIRAQGASVVLELVRRHPSIAALSLSDNFIGDAVAIGCAEILQWNTTLRMLDLSKNDISDTSAKYFAEALLVNHTISELYLDHNMISPKGESLIEKALEDSYSSCVVVLEVNKITPSVEAKLKKNKDRTQRAGQNYSNQQILDESKNQLDANKTSLDLGFFRLDGCPLSRLSLTSLTHLYLDNCGLSYIPPVFFSAHSLTNLSLVNNSIAYLPPGLFDLESLTHLDLTNNRLVNRLPEEISKLSNLRTLILSSNALAAINLEVCCLNNLKKLHLQGNQIYQLPFQIFTMTSLEDLNVIGNPMPEVFQLIYKAWAAKSSELDLSNMSLSEIPAEIGYLKSLTTVRLTHNRLKYLPPQLGELSNLKLLDVRDNQITELPWQLEGVASLDKIDFSGNPKLSFPDDTSVVKNILRQQKTFKAGPFRKVKLMLVGRENVGKTSIRQCLQAKDIKALIKMKKERGANISTDGIEMEDWIPQLDDASSSRDFKKQPIGQTPPQFNIWDYGGQEVYYLTHQFFINQRSIYLVIFNLKDRSEEISRVEYWLQSIRARAVQCPIGMVGTHADEVSNEYLENIKEYIHQKYISVFPNIKFFVPVSCKTRKNITNLQEVLLKLAMEQSYINTNYPASFHQLEELLLSQRNLRTPPVITMSEFTRWAESCGVAVGQMNSAAKLMNDLGIIVYFDDTKFGLNDFVILDPQWLTRLMSTLITTKPNFVKNGILLNRDLSQIWKPPEFPDSLHNALLSLLEKFEISYPLPTEKGQKRNLIPYLIQNEKGMEIFKLTSQAQVVRRSYRFDFLPFGFFSRLTVRVMHFIEPLYYYKNGIVFKEENGSWCLLEYATDTKLQLNIEVSGSLATRLLRLIVETVEVLLRGWYSVGYEVCVGCNCSRCLRIPIDKRSSYSLIECERLLAQDKPGVQCVPSMEFTDFPSELRGTIQVPFEMLAPDLVMSDLQEYKVNYSDITWQEKLGQGGFGEVFKATLNNETVAVKRLGVDLTLDDIVEVVREFRKEVWLSSTLQHPCIVSLKGCCVQPRPCMVLEFVPFGNLMSLLSSQDKALSWTWRFKAALNIADAVRFLHTRSPKIIHRDLKSPNVLIVSLSEDSEVVCKVTDFGESLAVATKAAARDKLANPAWLAPEIMRKEPYTEKADVFSFGIVMNELASRTPPYSEHEVSRSRFLAQFEDAILQGLRPTIPPDTPEAFAKLIRDCWHDDPDQRPRMEDLYTSLHTLLKNKPPSLILGSKPQLRPRATFLARGKSAAQLGQERLLAMQAPLAQSDPGTSVTSPPVPRDKPAPPPSSTKPKVAAPPTKPAEKTSSAPSNSNSPPIVTPPSPLSPQVQRSSTMSAPKSASSPAVESGAHTTDKIPTRTLPTPAPRVLPTPRPASANNATLQSSSTAPAATTTSTPNNNNTAAPVPRPTPRVSPPNLQPKEKEQEKSTPGPVKNQVNMEQLNSALAKGPQQPPK